MKRKSLMVSSYLNVGIQFQRSNFWNTIPVINCLLSNLTFHVKYNFNYELIITYAYCTSKHLTTYCVICIVVFCSLTSSHKTRYRTRHHVRIQFVYNNIHYFVLLLSSLLRLLGKHIFNYYIFLIKNTTNKIVFILWRR